MKVKLRPTEISSVEWNGFNWIIIGHSGGLHWTRYSTSCSV